MRASLEITVGNVTVTVICDVVTPVAVNWTMPSGKRKEPPACSHC